MMLELACLLERKLPSQLFISWYSIAETEKGQKAKYILAMLSHCRHPLLLPETVLVGRLQVKFLVVFCCYCSTPFFCTGASVVPIVDVHVIPILVCRYCCCRCQVMFRFPALLICCHDDTQTCLVIGPRNSKSTFKSWYSIADSPISFQRFGRVMG